MYNTNETDIYLSGNISEKREILQKQLSENIIKQEKTLELLINGTKYSKLKEFKDTHLIWNVASFINLISIDLKIAGKDLLLEEKEWNRRYYARQVCLIIYESINDFFDLLGNDFKKLINSKICNKKIEKELITIKKELNIFKSKYSKELKEIRNISIAHRDNDSLKQINSIKNINWSNTVELVTKYDDIIIHLGITFEKLINIAVEDIEERK